MRLWRIGRANFASTAFSGEGAQLHGGRWNPPGVSVVYTSETRALAVLESRAHSPIRVPHLVLIGAELSDNVPCTFLTPADLPIGWSEYPEPEELKQIGLEWITQAATVALVVPSAVIPPEHNIVLNPNHPDFRHLRIFEPEPFSRDPRLY